MRIVDRVAYINHDIDDAIRFGILAEDDLPAEEIEVLGSSGSTRIDTLVHDLVESSARAGDIVQSEEIGGALARCAASCSSASTWARRRAAGSRQAQETIATIFEALVERGDDPREITDFISGMTDRFALDYVRTLS